MLGTRMRELKDMVSMELARCMPAQRDDAWMMRLVDEPRFGWDWDALERGFFQPLHAWSTLHDARLRPALAGLLIEDIGHSADRHLPTLAALEVEYLAAIMLDDLRNGRDLNASTSSAVTVPLPTWVTIAYNARQLVPVMVARQPSNLTSSARNWLAQRFSHFLFEQGLGSVLDMWGSEQALVHASEEAFIDHLRLYVGTMSFGLACDVASAVTELDNDTASVLRKAGMELGVALRLAALAQGSGRALRGPQPSTEPPVRWQHGVDAARLGVLARQTFERSLCMAKAVAPSIANVFRAFAMSIESPVLQGVH